MTEAGDVVNAAFINDEWQKWRQRKNMMILWNKC